MCSAAAIEKKINEKRRPERVEMNSQKMATISEDDGQHGNRSTSFKRRLPSTNRPTVGSTVGRKRKEEEKIIN